MHSHQKLKNLRTKNGLSQQLVADKLNISQNAYSLLENGKTKLDEDRIYQLSKLFKVKPEYFLESNNNIVQGTQHQTSHNETLLIDLSTSNDLIKILTNIILEKDALINQLEFQITKLKASYCELPTDKVRENLKFL
ncbi:helix-turn-helix domain-containing protein [Mucilaginibacter sp. KACC 22063]|uniref:helix-turn-helix domain-containing protein n=1 Tax=Mucilaginibacter sp. KACC 22063 TaxID=3025666 RepID=UPI0023664F8D|nr:helix-turn-helix transcriptional regulator [Mucilaginibacter sp. KACC 22063]WDF54880.1 helix-turn-helix transcriptional regulator [Mucilaginibacter sp. KACC 22063]